MKFWRRITQISLLPSSRSPRFVSIENLLTPSLTPSSTDLKPFILPACLRLLRKFELLYFSHQKPFILEFPNKRSHLIVQVFVRSAMQQVLIVLNLIEQVGFMPLLTKSTAHSAMAQACVNISRYRHLILRDFPLDLAVTNAMVVVMFMMTNMLVLIAEEQEFAFSRILWIFLLTQACAQDPSRPSVDEYGFLLVRYQQLNYYE